jgi:hypothetical protein
LRSIRTASGAGFEYNCHGTSDTAAGPSDIRNHHQPGSHAWHRHSGEDVNKRKRVALAKRRTKKRKLKARAQTAR